MIGTRRMDRRAAPEPAASRDAEQLLALVHDCTVAGIQRRCFVLRLSRLPPQLAKPHHLRLAREAVTPLLAADRVQVFDLPNRDVAVIWRGPATAYLAAACRAVDQMFADHPAELPEPAVLCLVLDLPAQTEQLLDLVDASLAAREPAREGPDEASPPIDPAALTRLEGALVRADVARFARRRQIMALAPAATFLPAWELRTLSVDELAGELLAPGHAVRADPWLFARLTRTLDRRLLSLLADPNELRDAGPFGLDLNVASILGPEFLRFDTGLPQGLRGQVTLGMLPGDILADLAAFLFARDFARTRGYRLLLRLGSPDLLEVLPLDRLGLDLLQLGWTRTLAALEPARIGAVAHRLLLTEADTAEAVGWGRKAGIRLFSGRAATSGRVAPGPLALAGSPGA